MYSHIPTRKKPDTFFFFYFVHIQTVNVYCLFHSKKGFTFFLPCEENNLYSIIWYCAFLYGVHMKENYKVGSMLLRDGEMVVAQS